MKQKIAFDVLASGENIFLTGPAGSGKTFLLNKFIKFLKKKRINVAVTATTGIAATHMNGITIHSWSGMGVRDVITENDLKKIGRKNILKRRFEKTKVLVIDEISMLHDYQLDNVDLICRTMKGLEAPFGGMQVILCGDFFQLPPVNRNGNSRFVFHSKVWQDMNLRVCYLDENYRQKGNVMIKVLNDIRSGKVKEEILDVINSRLNQEIAKIPKPTKLFTHNKDVDQINKAELEKIKEKSFGYRLKQQGNEKLVEVLKNGCLAPEELILKKGAQVMFVKNNFEKGYVNGTLGTVVGFEEEIKMPIVETIKGDKILAIPEDWELIEGDEVLAKITQVPLRLAWAITVHKSQGMSLDTAEIDLGKTFEYGMGYVALSRVRSLDGIKLLGFNKMALEVSPEILEFNEKLIGLSKEFEKEIEE